LGFAIGADLLADYTMIAFAGGLVGYGLFSARERNWTGAGIAAAAALAAVSPNLVWNSANGFATPAQVIGDIGPGQGYFHPGELVAFVAAQFAVIGPVFLVAIGLALRNAGFWRDDWGMRLMA